MFTYFVIKRILKGIIMFIILMFMSSAIFNTVSEKTLKAQIEENINAEVRGLSNMRTEDVENFIKERRAYYYDIYWLNRSIGERIFIRGINTITFQFGKSSIMMDSNGNRDVIKIIGEALPRSIILFTTASVIQMIIGLIIGLVKARKAGGVFDRTTSIITMIVYGMPTWWLSMILIMVFVYKFNLFPSGGVHSIPVPTGIMYYLDMLWHMSLPLITLTLIGFWGLSFVVRNIVLSTLQEDYIMAARARGISEKSVLLGHTLRSSAPPIVTITLLGLLGSIAGSIIFEGIFSWPGLGNLYWISVQQNDIPVLMGNLAITTALYQFGLVVLDISYGFLDPRIKVGGRL
ncbi:ABC transporter permease [Brachyspira hampsonii]|uniref:Peptide ABC transporter permease n=1 Tax=Brachyspira hampsonii TaxID=1287055 RepID=A0AAC9TS42_9SPIR|nr:ABC transporter permease [Brachyspira hampsonii]ASJ20408.1 peptide ABC transporter permease [Brachyspira hampsonii]ELV05122.1 binding-protein-dependent transport system inner membrane protein [Brachyspira hampsonii 30599]MBW5380145.1 ABC transporter permease [Brachyspira hampsonii]MBW5409481.1 ABC transporter permease [Brachyspira hampsonii]OEJ16267.1 peptide ABC transporter permease [Brachyspira hampsonii]